MSVYVVLCVWVMLVGFVVKKVGREFIVMVIVYDYFGV